MKDYLQKTKPEELWTRKNKKVLSSNRIFDVVSHETVSPDKKISGEFYSLETKDWVNVIAITARETVILVKQYRHGLNTMSLELPGGIVEISGQDRHLLAAQAELREETGYTSNKWTLLGKISSNPGIMNNYTYCYLAQNSEKTESLDFDPHESIESFEIPLKELPDLIRKEIIHHSLMIASIGMYFMRKDHS